LPARDAGTSGTSGTGEPFDPETATDDDAEWTGATA
jgi:hypothetical protein